MNISNITWRGESIDDVEILRELPHRLVSVLAEANGFIVHEGALHFRGASLTPDWHSLRYAWRGPSAFHTLYESVMTSDIPFAQDQFGDQFLLRNNAVFRLSAETGEVDQLAESLDAFFRRLAEDIEGFLNIELGKTMQPGQLLLAYPPFIFKESGSGALLKPMQTGQVIAFHADLARQIKEVPDGGRIEIIVPD